MEVMTSYSDIELEDEEHAGLREAQAKIDELEEQLANVTAIALRYKAVAEAEHRKAEVANKVFATIEQLARDTQQLLGCRTTENALAALADELRRWA